MAVPVTYSARELVTRLVFVLVAAAAVLAGHVAGPFTAPPGVGVLAAGQVGARFQWEVDR